ncbi:uncharacterized protein LOC125668194 [Ostrea edulis]|uniref:uncharacterized protein LOC125668194 n=1 Tax=Ostrea edulis TaxID=37623 RepID=UPI0024AFFD0C|nr:uncharacterized protein LOC125668194 [Ostrea edulis]
MGNKSWVDIFEAINGHDFVHKLLDFGDAFISECVIPENNILWQDVFNSMLHVIKSFDKNFYKETYPSIPVWYNSNIRVGMKTLFIKSWYKKGVRLIDDFLDDKGNLLSHNLFQHKFDIQVCILQYNSVLSAISTHLKLFENKGVFNRAFSPYIPLFYKPLILQTKCTKSVYKQLNVNHDIPTSVSKWNLDPVAYGIEICVKDAFTVCFKTTKDSIIQWLQYRILHRILPVNYYLKKINVVSFDCCTFCNDEVETIQHVFIGCEKLSILWSNLSMHIYKTTSKRIGFNVLNILLGELPLLKGNRIVNFLILYTKQYIFSCLKKKKTNCQDSWNYCSIYTTNTRLKNVLHIRI